MDNFTPKDTNLMSWSEMSDLVNILISKIELYFSERDEEIHVMAPLLRTGGIVGGILSIKMHILTMLPMQFKYFYKPTTIKQISSTPDILVDYSKTINILLCEGNTSSGSIAVKAAAELKLKYPDAKIYLATLTKVYGGPEKLENIEQIFYGRMTDEAFKATDYEKKTFNLRDGVTIFPWENVEDELDDINSAL